MDAAARETDVTLRREGARRDLLAASGRSAEASNRERETALLEDRLSFALAKLQERKGRAAEVLAGRRAAVEEAARIVASASGTLEAARARLEGATHGRRAAEEQLAVLKTSRDALVSSLHAAAVRTAALETTLASREAGGESARRALEVAGVSPSSVLADHFEAAAGFETALDAALGAALEAPVLGSRSDLDAALRAVRDGKLGTARFVHPLPDTPFPLRPADPRVKGIARDLLTPKSDAAPASALPDAVVVANVDDALAIAAVHPERTLVTEDGVVVRGAVVEAAGTDVPGEGLFTVRRDLKGLAAERDTLEAKLADSDASIAALTRQAGSFAASLDEAVAAARAAEREHSEALAKAGAAREEEERARREIAVLEDEERGLVADLGRARESRAEAGRLAAARASEMATVERTLAELEASLDSARSARLSAAELDAAARNARDVLTERVRALADAAAVAEDRSREAARRVAELADALLELESRRSRPSSRGPPPPPRSPPRRPPRRPRRPAARTWTASPPPAARRAPPPRRAAPRHARRSTPPGGPASRRTSASSAAAPTGIISSRRAAPSSAASPGSSPRSRGPPRSTTYPRKPSRPRSPRTSSRRRSRSSASAP